MSEVKHAGWEMGGLMRCCMQSIPVDHEDSVLAGIEGEHRPCQHCSDKTKSGVRFVKGRWIAAWRDE